jgi:hypothetical protein
MRVFTIVLLLAIPAAAQYRAGASRIDITPRAGHAMGGYSARQGVAKGTHDPLQATVLVLESNGQKLAWIAADLRSFVSTRVGAEVKRRFGIGHTILSVSHTHSGPLTWESPTAWYAEAENRMIEAVGAALKQMEPATLAVSTGSVYLGFNRRKVSEDGKVEMRWRNEAKGPSHPVDPEFTVLTVKRRAGDPLAVVVNYACHPSILGPDNLEFSADYPGAMRRAIERALPGTLSLFVQGGAGDINPYRDKEPVPGGFAAADEAGSGLAKAVLASMTRNKPLTGAMRLASRITEVANRWKPEDKIAIGWTAGLIGDFCFLTLPGEPFVEHQLTFREKSECATSILAGYSYSEGGAWAGYLPTILAAVEGGYGADTNTTAAVGTGEMLIDQGVVKLFELRGLLKELPDVY